MVFLPRPITANFGLLLYIDTMVKVITFFGIAGGYFIALQMWNRYKANLSDERIRREQSRSSSEVVSFGSYFNDRALYGGAAQRFLNVRNFGEKELNVSPINVYLLSFVNLIFLTNFRHFMYYRVEKLNQIIK